MATTKTRTRIPGTATRRAAAPRPTTRPAPRARARAVAKGDILPTLTPAAAERERVARNTGSATTMLEMTAAEVLSLLKTGGDVTSALESWH
ncbi:MAG TPA: hypothetical protein VFV17_06780, partial [Usitatibacteraceae bacterium]|nr:hypothetical protein [Usitatibacteraceae bacterium]